MKPTWKRFIMFLLILSGMCGYVNGTTVHSTILPNDEDYLPFAEEMPAPAGGMADVIKNVVYPEIAKKAGIEGKVFVLAYINEKGGVDEVKVVKGIGAGCDEAACTAVKKVKFIPGKSKGENAKVKLSLSINFKLR